MAKVFVCQNKSGDWFIASPALAAGLEREDERAPVNVPVAFEVRIGTTAHGLRWAEREGFRVVAYALGGYSCNRWVDGMGWCLFAPGESMPEQTERALCCALEIEYIPDADGE